MYLWPHVPTGTHGKVKRDILIMQENRREKSQIKQKILLYLKEKGISEYCFYKESGVTRGVLKQNNGINEDNIARFLAYATDVNPAWLLTGEGNMIKTKRPSNEIECHHNADKHDKIIDNKGNIQIISHDSIADVCATRPRIPFDAAAGALSGIVDSVSAYDCEQLPLIPTLPKYDFTIIARGDSMMPEFYSGDELACAFVSESTFIQWGRPHVLDTSQGVVVKRIFDADGSILCKSANPDYPDFKIPKQDINHLAIVVGLLRHY